MPNANEPALNVTLGVGLIVVASVYASYWPSARGKTWASTGSSFVGTGAIDLAVALLLGLVPGPPTVTGHRCLWLSC